jgi:hypothetical protein
MEFKIEVITQEITLDNFCIGSTVYNIDVIKLSKYIIEKLLNSEDIIKLLEFIYPKYRGNITYDFFSYNNLLCNNINWQSAINTYLNTHQIKLPVKIIDKEDILLYNYLDINNIKSFEWNANFNFIDVNNDIKRLILDTLEKYDTKNYINGTGERLLINIFSSYEIPYNYTNLYNKIFDMIRLDSSRRIYKEFITRRNIKLIEYFMRKIADFCLWYVEQEKIINSYYRYGIFDSNYENKLCKDFEYLYNGVIKLCDENIDFSESSFIYSLSDEYLNKLRVNLKNLKKIQDLFYYKFDLDTVTRVRARFIKYVLGNRYQARFLKEYKPTIPPKAVEFI